MTSNMFTNRSRKLQPPKVCIAPPIDLSAPTTPIASTLNCMATHTQPNDPPGPFSISAVWTLTKVPWADYWTAPSPPPIPYFEANIWIDYITMLYNLQIRVITPPAPYSIFFRFFQTPEEWHPFDTGLLYADIEGYDATCRIAA